MIFLRRNRICQFLYLRHRSTNLTCQISSSFSTTTTNVPVLYKPKTGDNESDTVSTTTLQLFSWGRGASGQLGGGIEEIRLYPAPVANLLVPSSSFTISSPPSRMSIPNSTKMDNTNGEGVVEVGISCGLFHSSLLVDGKFWIWGKGDGGRLGFGHENSAFVPTMNPHLDSVRSVALGGLHSVALISSGQVFSWSVP